MQNPRFGHLIDLQQQEHHLCCRVYHMLEPGTETQGCTNHYSFFSLQASVQYGITTEIVKKVRPAELAKHEGKSQCDLD